MGKPGTSKGEPLRVLYMGMGGALSAAPLAALLKAEIELCAVVMPAPHDEAVWRALPPPQAAAHSVPLLTPSRTLLQLSWEHDIPLYETGALHAAPTTAGVRRLAPDVALVSCFPYRVPQTLLQIPRHGFLNLHPSHLPHYRGPYPLFWQLRDGLQTIGLTVHAMDQGLDSGPIALQGQIALDEGMDARSIEQRAGTHGGQLFIEALARLAAGTLTLTPQPQGGSYQREPQADDFVLDRHWPAKRAFNFMRATAGWGHPYTVQVGQQVWQLRQALAYEPTQQETRVTRTTDGRLRVPFTPGILMAR